MKTPSKKTTPREYAAWVEMRRRCSSRHRSSKETYLDKGIKVCPRWQSFAKFYEDMGPRPLGRFSLDRIDNSKGYYPSNCRWANYYTQNANRSVCIYYVLGGVKKCLGEWARDLGVSRHILLKILKSSPKTLDDVKHLLDTHRKHVYTIDGVKKSLKEWCRISGVKYITALARLRRGLDIQNSIKIGGGR